MLKDSFGDSLLHYVAAAMDEEAIFKVILVGLLCSFLTNNNLQGDERWGWDHVQVIQNLHKNGTESKAGQIETEMVSTSIENSELH